MPLESQTPASLLFCPAWHMRPHCPMRFRSPSVWHPWMYICIINFGHFLPLTRPYRLIISPARRTQTWEESFSFFFFFTLPYSTCASRWGKSHSYLGFTYTGSLQWLAGKGPQVFSLLVLGVPEIQWRSKWTLLTGICTRYLGWLNNWDKRCVQTTTFCISIAFKHFLLYFRNMGSNSTSACTFDI